MTRRITREFLARGPSVPRSEDGFLLSLVPAGTWVERQAVLFTLLDCRISEQYSWAWNVLDGLNLAWLYALRRAAAREVDRAIARQVLVCSVATVNLPDRPLPLERFRRLLHHMLTRWRRRHATAARPLSRPEAEAAAILDALDF